MRVEFNVVRRRVTDAVSVASRRSEGGYTLVALLAMMTVLALFAMAVAPSVQQQALREREKEAIFRGEQVADAIRDYYHYRAGTTRTVGDQALPTSMDQLLQGIPIPGGSKNRQILRASAARDPLTIEGEWRFVLPRTEALIDFQQSIMFYTRQYSPGHARSANGAVTTVCSSSRSSVSTNLGTTSSTQ